MGEDKKGIRTFVKRFVNPVLRNFAQLSFGPFALLRHVGRRSGKKYEIPIMVWPVEGGFVIELSYGRKVDWLRNLQAAGQGEFALPPTGVHAPEARVHQSREWLARASGLDEADPAAQRRT